MFNIFNHDFFHLICMRTAERLDGLLLGRLLVGLLLFGGFLLLADLLYLLLF